LIAIDTNILVYTVALEDGDRRSNRSLALMQQIGPSGAIVPLQVIGEFLNVCRRKKIISSELAAKRASEFLAAFDCHQTQPEDLLEASLLSARFTLQYFDALIIAVATRTGATMLLSEDMHDGLVVDALTIVNPFVAANAALIAAKLA
jgi:predicted nucleic acid-binding protein